MVRPWKVLSLAKLHLYHLIHHQGGIQPDGVDREIRLQGVQQSTGCGFEDAAVWSSPHLLHSRVHLKGLYSWIHGKQDICDLPGPHLCVSALWCSPLAVCAPITCPVRVSVPPGRLLFFFCSLLFPRIQNTQWILQ